MKTVLYFIPLFLYLISCSQATVEYKELQVKDSSSIELKLLNDTYTLGYATKILVHDSLLIVYDEMQEKKVLFFHKGTGEHLGSLGRLGQGAGEWIAPKNISVNAATGMLSVYDYAQGKIIAYDLSEFVSKNAEQWSYMELPEYEIRPNEVISVGENDFITIHGKPRFSKSNGNKMLASYDEFPVLPEFKEDQQAERMFFLTQSLFAARPDGRKIVNATTLGGILQIFDCGDSSIRLTAENYIYPPIFSVKKGQIDVLSETIYGFACMQATDKYIYATLHGVANPTVFPSIVYVFDWDGKPVKQFNTDQQICSFCVDEPEGRIYAVVMGKDNEQKIMCFE